MDGIFASIQNGISDIVDAGSQRVANDIAGNNPVVVQQAQSGSAVMFLFVAFVLYRMFSK